MITITAAGAPRKPLRKQAEQAAGGLVFEMLLRTVRALSLPRARALGAALGRIAFHLIGRYRRVAMKNLGLVYGESAEPAEIRRMAVAVFEHFGTVAAEFLKAGQLSDAEIDAMTDVVGREHLDAAFAPGTGVLLMTGHIGNWEFMARWLAQHGYPLNVIARKANDPRTERLLTKTRVNNGAKVYSRGNSARAVIQCLRKNELVALLYDQNAADVFVPFLGLSTGTVDGPAVVHLRTGAPLLFSWCMRQPDGRFLLEFEEPVVMQATADRDADICAVTTVINARLERWVRRYPTQWLWLHDRWKASPWVFGSGAPPASARPGSNG